MQFISNFRAAALKLCVIGTSKTLATAWAAPSMKEEWVTSHCRRLSVEIIFIKNWLEIYLLKRVEREVKYGILSVLLNLYIHDYKIEREKQKYQ